jgi:pyrophosphate--fructose-6-phosphate 1-phosphotransferase
MIHSKTYAHEIGDIARDCRSARKYWFFIKMMGRSASHITLECALQTRPNIALISEEVAEKEKTLADVAREIADVVQERSRLNKNYGMCIIPEGLVEFIPEFKVIYSYLFRGHGNIM